MALEFMFIKLSACHSLQRYFQVKQIDG